MNKTLVTTLKKWREFRQEEIERLARQFDEMSKLYPNHMVIDGNQRLNTAYEVFMDWWVKQAEEEGLLDEQD